MKIKYLLPLVLLPCNTYASDSVSAYFGGWSHHLVAGEYNEKHDYIGVEYNKVHFGSFVNSYNARSYILAYNWNGYVEDYNLEYGMLIGTIHGYTKDKVDIPMVNGFMPAIVPYVKFTKYPIKPTIGFMGPALFLTFEFKY